MVCVHVCVCVDACSTQVVLAIVVIPTLAMPVAWFFISTVVGLCGTSMVACCARQTRGSWAVMLWASFGGAALSLVGALECLAAMLQGDASAELAIAFGAVLVVILAWSARVARGAIGAIDGGAALAQYAIAPIVYVNGVIVDPRGAAAAAAGVRGWGFDGGAAAGAAAGQQQQQQLLPEVFVGIPVAMLAPGMMPPPRFGEPVQAQRYIGARVGQPLM
jgi:hypothetical protein